MTKKMKNIEMVNAVNALSSFVAKDKVVPVKLSFAISSNIKTLIRELEPYEEVRQKLIGKESVENQFKELCETEVDVNLRTVSTDLLEDVEMSTKDYLALEFMLEENEEPESQSE